MKTTLLICAHPNRPKAWHALDCARDLACANALAGVFFYGDGAYVANAFCWQSADTPDIAAAWADFAKQYGFTLSVCVGSALARGISDEANARRHNLSGHNLRSPFVLVGLSDLATQLEQSRLLQI